jgi:serine protease AprX
MAFPRLGWHALPIRVDRVTVEHSYGLGTCRMPLRVRRLLGVTGSTLAAGALALTSVGASAGGTATTATVGARHASIVLARPGQLQAAIAAVRATGGTVGKPMPIINGFTASVSTRGAATLNRSRSVVSVTPDSSLASASSSYNPATPGATYQASSRASGVWATGDTGRGVTVAVLDTGVANVPDLSGRLIRGPDLSGEGNSLQDGYGHGTVMAGLIAGSGASSGGAYPGIAPGARIVSVKVAGRGGATDVSQVLAGLQWIGTYAAQYNIKVVSVAWGSPSNQSPLVDPLDFAVERLWGLGITVLVAAGNDGPGPMTVTKPGDDPAVITVGAYDDLATAGSTDDAALDFSSRGPTPDGVSKPDLVAPGRTLISTRSPGSVVEQQNPQALVSGGYIRGSGTSQATAVTAGGAALLLSAHPDLTPDQVKYALTSTAHPIGGVDGSVQGAGELRLLAATSAHTAAAPTQPLEGLGLGSLEASRGGLHVSVVCPGATAPTELIGEENARCGDFDADVWTADVWTADVWTADVWTADVWTADVWTADVWTADVWTADVWTADVWTADVWTTDVWTDYSWDSAPAAQRQGR